MTFSQGSLAGVWKVTMSFLRDERGFLARSYCADAFRAHGLNTSWVQCSFTQTTTRGALRGMHWQEAPHSEIKLIRCEHGAVWDVLVDIRRESPTFGQWEAFELRSETGMMLYVPEGVAHGFQCLETESRLYYMMSAAYEPLSARGIRYNDVTLGITWPLPVTQVSPKDLQWPGIDSLYPQG
jgi:dTDP-4-dehydrorhamnose 3,5-epimerase